MYSVTNTVTFGGPEGGHPLCYASTPGSNSRKVGNSGLYMPYLAIDPGLSASY